MENVWNILLYYFLLKITQLYFKTPQKNKNKMELVIWERNLSYAPKIQPWPSDLQATNFKYL